MSFARLGRVAAGVTTLSILLFTLAPAAFAKGQIQARLDQAIPKDAKPGTVVTVAWSLGVLEGSTWVPLWPDGAFIRLVGKAGGGATEVAGRPAGLGHYTADIAIPAGGVSTVWLGVDARCIGPACVHTSQDLYPLTSVGGLPAVVPARELILTMDPPPPLGPPYSAVDVTLRASLRPGVHLGARVLPGTFVVRAVDARTGLATYETAVPIGDGRYRATLEVAPGETLAIEAGTQAVDRLALASVMTVSPTTLTVPALPTALGASARAGSSPAASDATGTTPRATEPVAAADGSTPLVVISIGALVAVGLVLARRWRVTHATA